MIFRSLYAKLAIVLLGLLAVVGLTFVSISVYSTEMYQQEVSQKLNRTLAESIISRKIVMRNSLVDERALKEVFSMLMTINPVIEVYLLDPQGEILAYSADPGKVKRLNVHLEPIAEFLAGSDALPILGDDPRSPEGKKIFSAARIPREGKLELDHACRSRRDGDGGVGDAGLADAQTEASGRRDGGLFRGDRFRSAQSSRIGRRGARG